MKVTTLMIAAALAFAPIAAYAEHEEGHEAAVSATTEESATTTTHTDTDAPGADAHTSHSHKEVKKSSHTHVED